MSKPLTTTDIADFDVIFNSDDSGTPAGKGVGGGRNPYRPFPSDPDYIGYRNQGHTATDKDWVPPKDRRTSLTNLQTLLREMAANLKR